MRQFRITECGAGDEELAVLVSAMTKELVALYGLAPDARPAPLAAGAQYLLARDGAEAVGCCAVQPVSAQAWELKRMYVRPQVRGTGVAVQLLTAAEELAAARGACVVRLETGRRQPAAVRLYTRAGYRLVPAWPPHDADPESICFAKQVVVPSGT